MCFVYKVSYFNHQCVHLSRFESCSPVPGKSTCVTFLVLTNCYIFTIVHHATLFTSAMSTQRRRGRGSHSWCNRLPNPAVGSAELGIVLLRPLHSSVRLTISESQQIVDGGLSSVCLGEDNCQLADAQHPMPTVLVSCFQMRRILGIIPAAVVRSPRGCEVIPPSLFFFFQTSLQTINTPFQYPRRANHWFYKAKQV